MEFVMIIIGLALAGVGYQLGKTTGEDIAKRRFTKSLYVMYKEGKLKAFDPTTGKELPEGRVYSIK